MGLLPGFDATPVELQAASAQLRRIGSEVRDELAQLDVCALGLLDAGWRGQAAVAFQRGWSQWFAGAVEILDALDAMARLLAATAEGYDGADEDSSRVISYVGGQV